MNIDVASTAISKNIYFDAFKEDWVKIRCNLETCHMDVLWEGQDWEHVTFDWLGMAIEHLVEKHPELFT